MISFSELGEAQSREDATCYVMSKCCAENLGLSLLPERCMRFATRSQRIIFAGVETSFCCNGLWATAA